MNNLTVDYIKEILDEKKSYLFANHERDLVLKSFNYLNNFSEKKLVYGVNTGFGPMADYGVSKVNRIDLQYNLIRSHASGMGSVLPSEVVKVLMIIRLHTFLFGKSGVSLDLVDKLDAYISHGIYPEIFEHGGVGASGDLVQLAHLALGIIGEGDAYDNNNCRYKMSDLLQQKKIKPHSIKLRDALAIMNGTACMTALSSINVINSKVLISCSISISAMMLEIFGSYDDYISKELNNVKNHVGQNKIAELLRGLLVDSKAITKRYSGEEKKVQEFYSVRCTPQILGPILDTILSSQLVVNNEINSVDDNPIIDFENNKIVHGGNFHGDYISSEMDKLKIAITKLTILTERQLNLLLNSKSNKILPPFLNSGELGLNYGMQGVQFTATSTTAENQMLSNPMSVHSITCNNDNQDIVSMGTNSALITQKIIDNCFQVVSIQMLACIRAIKILEISNQVCKNARGIFDTINKKINLDIKNDFCFHNDLKLIENFVRNFNQFKI